MAVAGDRGPGSNGLDIASVLVGMVAVPLFFFPVPAAAAIVLGVVGHRHARDLSGEIMGVIGATVGIVITVLFVVLVALNFDDVTHTMPLTDAARGRCFKETYPEDIMVRKHCGERHGSELFAIVQHPAPAGVRTRASGGGTTARCAASSSPRRTGRSSRGRLATSPARHRPDATCYGPTPTCLTFPMGEASSSVV